MIDVDATLVEIHSENKEDAAPHFKGGYGIERTWPWADAFTTAWTRICAIT